MSGAANPIDAFLLTRLAPAGLAFSPPTDRATLLRRLNFDLTGIPPSPGEVETFLKDRNPGAYERCVDRLLASPHYGERWGKHWLDAARYADSNGYSIDAPRSIWPYRDWVVDAINRDLPFDEFVVQQLAGDLLPGATDALRVATGFHRNTMINEEGGIDPEQFRIEAVFDRVNTTGAVFLGLTMGCAQCHDHKYDPLSQRDYYRLFACFNGDDEPVLRLPDPASGRTNSTLVLAARKEPRATHVFTKGDFTRPRERVEPGIPEVFVGPALSASTARLGLARWIVSRENPLTARVMVNRYWQRFFGVGLVETENDLGSQGTAPTHPELLDWLACEFRERGWSVKSLHRLLVTSAAYQQSSIADAKRMAADPLNKLWSRQGRNRLDAEVVRDAALSAAGLLERRIGGPSVFPPSPEGATSLGQVKRAWTPSAGADRYRRGLYTFAWRATPFPAFTVFDAPDGTSTCTRRFRSNTPLQALTLLNDPGFHECAAELGRRLERGGSSDQDRVNFGFAVCLARKPSAVEADQLLKVVRSVRLARAHEGRDLAESAAWTAAGRVLLNLDEFFTRE